MTVPRRAAMATGSSARRMPSLADYGCGSTPITTACPRPTSWSRCRRQESCRSS
jgi:hypothetical protein